MALQPFQEWPSERQATSGNLTTPWIPHAVRPCQVQVGIERVSLDAVDGHVVMHHHFLNVMTVVL
jgi:hypothetical protein